MVDLKAGDIFVVAPPKGHENFASKLIVSISTLHDVDGRVQASHAGIILDDKGTTFEAIEPRYCQQNIWEAYAGCQILIGRHKDMSPYRAQEGWQAVSYLEGMSYPEWRLPLFRWGSYWARTIHAPMDMQPRMVCSEKVMRYLAAGGCRKNENYGPIDYWFGVDPAYVENAINGWRLIDVVLNTFKKE